MGGFFCINKLFKNRKTYEVLKTRKSGYRKVISELNNLQIKISSTRLRFNGNCCRNNI